MRQKLRFVFLIVFVCLNYPWLYWFNQKVWFFHLPLLWWYLMFLWISWIVWSGLTVRVPSKDFPKT